MKGPVVAVSLLACMDCHTQSSAYYHLNTLHRSGTRFSHKQLPKVVTCLYN